MRSVVLTRASLLIVWAHTATADLKGFFWSNSSSRSCGPDFVYSCTAPEICVLSTPQSKHYCCMPGDKDGVCWTSAPRCDGGRTGEPGGAQISCSSGANAFCCLKDSEKCTQSKDQINICWSTQQNPVALLNATIMNETYNSLASASPSAASFPIELAVLQKMTATSSIASPTSSPTSSLTLSPTTANTIMTSAAATTSPAATSDNGFSGGAIGGIAGGVIGGIALLAAIAFLVWQRRRSNSTVAQNELPATQEYYANGHQFAVSEMDTASPPTEKYARHGGYVSEMPARQSHYEMSADSPLK
ncbi:hypothetical protein CC86DRAFT_380123 [Ophiobolus disseminans]|uniref:Mid2 domain-containing protein n=1 Tax=Ophiobolus disseminans TaxID=1469910 RepID=A0A6A7A8C6_9PLEO|nr:hypothetical protein CC86DRAFT_380123 [Ophiobolus disseminans]